jgi:hypothetical protein
MTKPAAGEVFRYPFLWKREQMVSETEGRKTRPVCIAVTVAKSHNETVVFILPITTQPPLPSRKFIEVPQIEAQRVGLETHVRKWVMLDEINTDILERSYVWEDRTPIGMFSSVFTSKIQSSLIAICSGRKIHINIAGFKRRQDAAQHIASIDPFFQSRVDVVICGAHITNI